jgi:hypothetical protein
MVGYLSSAFCKGGHISTSIIFLGGNHSGHLFGLLSMMDVALTGPRMIGLPI